MLSDRFVGECQANGASPPQHVLFAARCAVYGASTYTPGLGARPRVLGGFRPASPESKKPVQNAIPGPRYFERAWREVRMGALAFQQVAALSTAEDIIGAPAHVHIPAISLSNPRMLS